MTMMSALDRPSFLPPKASMRRGADGSWLIESCHRLNGSSTTVFKWLRDWAKRQPDGIFLAERKNAGWRTISYAEMLSRTEMIARRLLGAGCNAERPVVTICSNSIDLAAVSLAAIRCGVPAANLSPAYLTKSLDFKKLNAVLAALTPGLIYLGPLDPGEAALMALSQHATIFSMGNANIAVAALHELPLASDAILAGAESLVNPSTIAKILFTSGSTAMPKGVINTNQMLCASQDGHAIVWPLLSRERPVLLDWLPWNHTFGGNFVFNMVLRNGGSLYIDAGTPLPSGVTQTVENLAMISPTIYFNVPSGYDALLAFFEADNGLARSFFARLNFVFSSGAALPQKTADRLTDLAKRITGRNIPVSGAWGSTETAPTSTILHFPAHDAANIGLPVPGVTIKLAPVQDRLELRVRGPNVTPGYWRDDALTQSAFDEDGFFKMGDAGKLADPAAPHAGILFDGRLSENFKLLSGTWVDVNRVRLSVIAALHPLARDIVVCGHDSSAIALMIFPNMEACRQALELPNSASDKQIACDPKLGSLMAAALALYNQTAPSSSTSISRFIILVEAPRPQVGEITEKGYVNQRAVREARQPAHTLLLAGYFESQASDCSSVYHVKAARAEMQNA